MVYLAELLVVMTDGLIIVRIRAWNVSHVHGHKRLDDDAFLASLSRSMKAAVLHVDAQRYRPVETLKYRLRTTCACLAVASAQESCHDSMPSSLWHQIWAIWLQQIQC